MPEQPDEQLLFAVLVIEKGYATPAQVANSLSICLSQRKRTLAAQLEADGIISPQHRLVIDLKVQKALSDQAGTMADVGKEEPPDATQVDPPAPVDDTIGTVTPEQPGRYTIQGIHGRGGQARVMLAIDEHIGRDVALKELLADRMDGEATSPWASPHSIPGVVRFLREARVTGQLEHPNIVPVYEVGRRDDGTFYYTMRLVRGHTLAHKLDECKGLQDRMKLLGTFWDMCKAVAYAHSRGVVHRDIKPSNIMVGEFGETVLLDWGIAKVKGRQDIGARDIQKELKLLHSEDVEHTTAGSAMGTPSYMSPEQARGEIDGIDERSDVWGLGAVLYEILSGHPPFEGKRRAEILIKVGRKAVRPVLELCKDAPAELAAITHKCLRRDKTDRYQATKELTEDVGAYMTGEKVTAYQYSSWELLKRFASQHKPAIIAAAVILGAVIGALISVSLSLRAESLARQNETAARKQEQAARAKEHQERLVANHHLAGAYAEKADRLMVGKQFLSAQIFAAASLLHNPAHPKSPFHDVEFDKKYPRSHDLRVEASSQIYGNRFRLGASLAHSVSTGEVLTRISFSPDGKTFAVGSYDGSIHLWDPDSGQPRFTLRGHKDRVYDVSFSSTGLLASAGHDTTVRLWDAKSGSPLFNMRGHTRPVHGVAFSSNGNRLASASYDGTIRIWNVQDQQTLAVLRGHRGKVSDVEFSPDGSLVATAGDDKTIRMWKLPEGKRSYTLSGHTAAAYCVAFSPDGRYLATGANDRTLRIWDVDSRRTVRVFKGHSDGILSVAFSPDGTLVATAAYDQTVRIWKVDSGELMLTIDHQGFVYGVAFCPDGKHMVSSGYDKIARVWNLQPGRKLSTFRGHRGTVYSLVFSSDGKVLASAGWDKTIRVWDVEEDKPLAVLKGHSDVIDGLAFAPDDRRLASASRDKTIRIWNWKRDRAKKVLRGHMDAVYATAFSPDGELLASSSLDRTLCIWDAEAGKKLFTLRGHHNEVDNIAFSPDGQRLASAGHDRTVRIWNPRTGEQQKVLGGHTDWVSGVAFSHDGKHLVSSGKDKIAILWDAASGQEIGRLEGHTQWVNTVKFSPDDRLVLTASDDRTVRLWSVESRRQLLKIPASSEVVAIDFSPDGSLVAIGDGDDVKVYPVDFTALDADPTLLQREAEKSAGMKLEGFRLETGK